ncbi:MAG: hypothetical protein JJW03_05215 [Desulfosarcina sp.]|nr:hypothetical protein [Desulfobacterales bacterium]
MASKAEQKMLKYLAIMAIIPELMRQNKPSKTVNKMIKKIDTGFAAARELYPELIFGSKDCNRIEAEVFRLQSQKTIHICCLTSVCLAGFDEGLKRLKDKRKTAVMACLMAVKRLHGYFDRNLNLNDEYDKAMGFI